MLAALVLSAAVLAGMAFMTANGAPASYPLVNGAALAIALAIIAVVRARDGLETIVLIASVALLLTPFLFPAGIDGVMRWIVIGPIRLHTGFVAVPMLVAILAKVSDGTATAAIALAALALALQPDRASAFALVCGLAAITASRRDVWSVGHLGLAVAALGVALTRPDPLAPVRFVENVLQDAWAHNPIVALALAVPIAAVLLLGSGLADRAYRPIAAATGGFLIASLAGAYPTPLIGYGAASILGFGLAIAVIHDRREMSVQVGKVEKG